MPERFFRYIPTARASAWQQAGWNVISVPLSMQSPAGSEAAGQSAIDVVIVEWQQPGQPVEPNGEQASGGRST